MFVRSLNYFAIVFSTYDLGNNLCITNKNYSAWYMYMYIHPFLEFNFSSGFFGLFCLFVCFFT